MTTKIANRRRQRRYLLPDQHGAVVEFEYPQPNGRHFRLRLVDVSSSGISFAVPTDSAPTLELGTNLAKVVIRIGSCMIQGDLLIMHTTQEPNEEPICGALLYPASDTDLLKLKSVVSGMEAVGP